MIIHGRALYLFAKLVVHVLPVFATVTLSYLNLAGFFIGPTLNGIPSASAQSMERLILQVTARLLVSTTQRLALYLADYKDHCSTR